MATEYSYQQKRIMGNLDEMDELVKQEIESGEVNKLIRDRMKQIVYGLRVDMRNEFFHANMTCEQRTEYRINRAMPKTSVLDMD